MSSSPQSACVLHLQPLPEGFTVTVTSMCQPCCRPHLGTNSHLPFGPFASLIMPTFWPLAFSPAHACMHTSSLHACREPPTIYSMRHSPMLKYFFMRRCVACRALSCGYLINPCPMPYYAIGYGRELHLHIQAGVSCLSMHFCKIWSFIHPTGLIISLAKPSSPCLACGLLQ